MNIMQFFIYYLINKYQPRLSNYADLQIKCPCLCIFHYQVSYIVSSTPVDVVFHSILTTVINYDTKYVQSRLNRLKRIPKFEFC